MGLERFFRREERRRGRRAADPESTSPATSKDEAGEPAVRAADLAYSLGQMRPDEQRIAAVERLTELRAAGEISEENFVKEKRRLQGKG